MTWYAAHVVMYLRFKDGVQDKHNVQENVVLVEGPSPEEAQRKAVDKATADYVGDSDGSLRCDGRPATWELVGIRALVSCEDDDQRPSTGTEVTYLGYALQSEDDLPKLMAGQDVLVEFDAK